MRLILVILIFGIGFFGCKKNKEKPKMTIMGCVKDNSDNSAVGASVVKIYYKPYQNGVFMTSYTLLTSTTANADGNYVFIIEKPPTSDFKFVVEPLNYFGAEKVINPDNLSLEGMNIQNFVVDPSGSLQIHLKNLTPVDSADYFQFQTLGLNYSCSTCCSSTPIIKIGETIDTTFTCMRYSKRYIKYTHFKTKGGSTTLVNDSIYCAQGVTTNLDILY